jgi:hypothetical protein
MWSWASTISIARYSDSFDSGGTSVVQYSTAATSQSGKANAGTGWDDAGDIGPLL